MKKITLIHALRVALIALVAGFVAWFFLRENWIVSSAQAVINSEIISLRAPVDGDLRLSDGVRAGAALAAQAPVFTVENPRFGNLDVFTQIIGLRSALDQAELDLETAQIERRLYARNFERLKTLIDGGGISEKEIDAERSRLDAAVAASAAKERQSGHLKELYTQAQRQLEMQKVSAVAAPADGVVWAVVRRSGETVVKGDEAVQLIRPEDVWVEAFFHERHASKLRAGMNVRVRELGGPRHWPGKVAFIRAGVGRVTYNSPVAVPPQKLRERLVVVRVNVDWDEAFGPGEFFGVGRSVEVAT